MTLRLAPLSEIGLNHVGWYRQGRLIAELEAYMKSYCKGLKIDKDLVDKAAECWLGGESGKRNGWRICLEYGSRDALENEILAEIENRCLKFAPIRRHPRHEPSNGKLRIICVESIKQQICDYLAVNCLEEFLNAKIGYYQIGATKGKGGVFALKAIRKWTMDGGYFVKSDIRKCYPSIKVPLVVKILRKYIRSDDVIYLCESLLNTYEDGLDIGSFLSLKMSALVLSFAYHYAEGLGKFRRGKWKAAISHQIWNMDDCLFFGNDKRDLKRAVRQIEKYLKAELGLTLKPWKVSKISAEPVDMCGYRISPVKVRLRSPLFKRAARAYRRYERRRTVRMAKRCASYWGYYKYASVENFRARRGIDRINGDARRLISKDDRSRNNGKNDFSDRDHADNI